MHPPFIQGLDLSERLYLEVVSPILDECFPGLPHAAALIGPGSEVLGFDTAQSRDHDWGPRLQLFLSAEDHARHGDAIVETMGRRLPRTFLGYPTGFGDNPDGTGTMAASDAGPIPHRVTVHVARDYFRQALGFDPAGPTHPSDWLTVPAQVLGALTAGRVFRNDGQLTQLRRQLAWYPDDVWRYLLAAQWARIGQEEAFPGRCAQTGDELGSRLVASRLVRDVMRLCFLMERVYAPYIKWFGSAFARLDCAPALQPTLARVLDAGTWPERQDALGDAYTCVAEMHNDLSITEPLPTTVTPFYSRPFDVIHGEVFADAILATIQDERVLALPDLLGSVDQFLDSTDALHFLERFRRVYN